MNIPIALAIAVAAAAAPAGAQPDSAIIPMPPRAVLDRALSSIEDRQLAEQVRPGRPIYAPDCVVHLAVYKSLATAPQRIAIERAIKAWRASLVREMGKMDADQLIGSSVNPLAPTPAPLTQAAVSWCLANAPRQ